MSSYAGFGKGSGPSAPPKSQPSFGANDPFSRPHPPPPPSLPSRSTEPSAWGDRQKLLYNDLDTHAPERPSSVTTFIASRDSMSGVTARVSRFPNPERTRSPPISYADVVGLRNSSQTFVRNPPISYADVDDMRNSSQTVPRNPPISYADVDDLRNSSQTHVRNPPISYADVDDLRNSSQTHVRNPPISYADVVGLRNSSQTVLRNPPISYADVDDLRNSSQTVQRNNRSGLLIDDHGHLLPQTSQSPPLFPVNYQPPAPVNYQPLRNFQGPSISVQQPSISPPRLGSTTNVPRTGPHSQTHQKSLPSSVSEASVRRPISSTAPKRTRSPPPSFSANDKLEGIPIPLEDNAEREMLAKAKRLARFKVDLSKYEENNVDVSNQTASANGHEPPVLKQKYVGGQIMDSAGNFTNSNAASDIEGLETSNVIIGLCPDMCPESERGERERKGDLDQYERLDGDRNITSRLLAVKKYTRTAEREANLIRPMPILQKTMDYLLTLLDQPYDESFLRVYNFLWDRMRAIRMDLRMQHIFNQGAITMLEQMIKLHIIAMHELCEYTKGEGFSEGFDAHLNIEQMNKTSVELFQIYDDHRKKGVNIPTEKEFRGYYALLKLDKHPGYKVEPAELSLDLAKMTPEIRQTPEVLFARNVARACRTGNFIAFFRLARKATYLQACLMHAHFAKLRTQALASLHSGLQNQGLPVAHVSNWLAMEDEGIEGLLEYHGFSIKVFEEPYMVKEGPFLNVDTDYPTKCSKLVHKKRSGRIVEDVSRSIQAKSLPVETMKEIQMEDTYKHEPQKISAAENASSVQKPDEEIQVSEPIFSPKYIKPGKAFKEIYGVVDSGKHNMPSTPSSPLSFPFPNIIPEPQHTRIDGLKSTNSDLVVGGSPRRKLHCDVDAKPLEIIPKRTTPEIPIANSFFVPPPAQSVPMDESTFIHQEHEDEIPEVRDSDHDEEIAEARLKLLLRLWRRRASKLRMLREERQLASNAALDSLPLGPPIRHYREQPGNFDKFDIDIAMRERYEKQEKSQSRLDVSDMVAGSLSRRNPDAKCLCWKIILGSQMESGMEMGAAGSWLTSKLMPSCDDDDVVISSPGLVIWRKWIYSQSDIDPTCCFSVVRDTAFGSLDEAVSGASAVLFLVSESISWKLQRVHLHNLLMSIPSGACLPLLVLCSSHDEGFSSGIINELGLQDIDRFRVSSFRIVFLRENQQMEHLGGFFSDTRLREGLHWLASESPLQPNLHSVNTLQLVHRHINSFSGEHDISNNSKLCPNDCISLFNVALDCSVQEIAAAANSNPAGWPCSEIGLLHESCDEDRVVKNHLPTLGWSSNAKTEPITCALQNCKLPAFADDLSWLAGGSKAGHEIENQRIQLENYLIQYMTQTSNMMGLSLATNEAHVLTQTCARLELCGSGYCIVPHWGMIFRRLFNWRLMSLSSRENSMAYISECHHHDTLPNVGFEACLSSSYHPNTSLDEIISVSCNSPLPVNDQPRHEEHQHLPQRDSNDESSNTMDAEINLQHQESLSMKTTSTYGLNNANNGALMNRKPSKEAEKLSKLLEQCNLLQDSIDRKLFPYF
ncbi:SAC3 family protein B isoform X2 [Lotus japonicus]|uniref:SAC3 family protein B isoform X2 n=1 Tax=Lotus japonicus TaxID=34305 RepID=UPI0025868D02|nr:SAC3 family protein B isoform X2 [Lotus japonicus]